jgi:MarR family transcriptional regulator, 2-MHQ and catechol-resistance regulon repressor
MSPPTAAPRRPASQERALRLFVVLERAAVAVERRVKAHADLHGLTWTEFEILEALFHKGPLLLGDVQKKILLTSGGVTYTVDRLAEKGLVVRKECETDRRARYAALTPKGTALITAIFSPMADHIEALMSVLDAREQEQATDMLRRVGLAAARESTG